MLNRQHCSLEIREALFVNSHEQSSSMMEAALLSRLDQGRKSKAIRSISYSINRIDSFY
jgi:hypothetical protein